MVDGQNSSKYIRDLLNFKFYNDNIDYLSDEFMIDNCSYANRLSNITFSDWKIISCIIQRKANSIDKATILLDNPIKEKLGDEVSLQIKFFDNEDTTQKFVFYIQKITTCFIESAMLWKISLIHKIGLLQESLGFNVFNQKSFKEIIENDICSPNKIKTDMSKMPILDPLPIVIQYNETLLNFFKRCVFISSAVWKNQIDGSILIGTNNTLGVAITDTVRQFILDQGILLKHNILNKNQYINIAYNQDNPDVLIKGESDENDYQKTAIDGNYIEEQMSKKSTFQQQQSVNQFMNVYCLSPLEPYTFLINADNEKYYVYESTFFFGIRDKNFINFSKMSTNIPDIDFQAINPKIQTATIIGPSTEISVKQNKTYIETYGIQFHFDTKPEKTTIQVPLKKYYASQNAELLCPYLPDDLVLIDFLYGDINKPIIVGSMQNAKNLFPANKPKTAVGLYAPVEGKPEFDDTKSTFFYLVGDDQKETILAHSPGTYSVITENGDISITANQGKYIVLCKNGNIEINTKGSDGNIIIDAENELQLKCKNMKINVEQNFDLQANNINMKADQKTTIKVDTSQIDVNSSQCKIHSPEVQIAADSSMSIKSASISINGNINGNGTILWSGATTWSGAMTCNGAVTCNGAGTFSVLTCEGAFTCTGEGTFAAVVNCVGAGNFGILTMGGTPLSAIFLPG